MEGGSQTYSTRDRISKLVTYIQAYREAQLLIILWGSFFRQGRKHSIKAYNDLVGKLLQTYFILFLLKITQIIPAKTVGKIPGFIIFLTILNRMCEL